MVRKKKKITESNKSVNVRKGNGFFEGKGCIKGNEVTLNTDVDIDTSNFEKAVDTA